MSEGIEEMEKRGNAIRMKVIGVGGAGSNMVDRLMLSGFSSVAVAVVNTDQQALSSSPVMQKLCIGKSVTGGLGAAGDVEAGTGAALADLEEIDKLVEGVDLLFLTAGLGGGTGTGATPVIAAQAVKAGAIVIAFVALPFSIERVVRAGVAQDGLGRLRDVCNAVIPLPNDLLIQESAADASLLDAFSKADSWIERAVKSIWLMINETGMINLDFAQLRQTFSKKAGKTLFGLGSGSGEDAAKKAVEDLRLCPLLHTPEFSKRADRLLVNIIGGACIGIADTQMIMESVSESFGAESNIAMGAVVDENLGDRIEICVIGTSDVSNISISSTSRNRISNKAKTYESAFQQAKAPQTHSKSKTKKTEQHEFSFSEREPKGEFENSEGFMFEGQDLDAPTFMRKGVKIAH